MKDFMMIFVGKEYVDLGMSPEELQSRMEKWFAWGAKMEKAGILKQQVNKVFSDVLSKQNEVHTLIEASFLNEKAKRNYTQAYQTRLKKLTR